MRIYPIAVYCGKAAARWTRMVKGRVAQEMHLIQILLFSLHFHVRSRVPRPAISRVARAKKAVTTRQIEMNQLGTLIFR